MAEITISQALQIALQHHQSGRFAEAEGIYRRILARQAHPDALHLLGLLMGQTGQAEQAIALIRQAIALSPKTAIYHLNLGKFLTDQRRLEDAIAACREAVALAPNLAEAYNNLGVALKAAGEPGEAVDAFRRAVEIKPDYSEAHNNLGNALQACIRLDEATAAYRRAIVLNPRYGGAHLNLGMVQHAMGLLSEAEASCRTALRLDPKLAEAHNRLGNILAGMGQLEEAVASFRAAMALASANAEFHSNLILAMNYGTVFSPDQVFEESRRWAEHHAEALLPAMPLARDDESERKLRIGYLSGDLRAHPVGRFLQPLFDHHDRGQFEIIAYSDVVHPDEMTKTFKTRSDGWHNIVGMTDEAVSRLIHSHGLDILVDLAGHTAGNRLLVFARRPAPVQVSYLGYPSTTGMSAIDYRLTDALADPPGHTELLHTEKLWRLPATNWCFVPPTRSPEPVRVREERTIVFGSFNNFTKVTPEMMDLWARLLAAVPKSRLMIKSLGLQDDAVQGHIFGRFSSHGIDRSRLILQGWVRGIESHLAVYQQVDIALDTYPYHGTTTTCEAFWMGVPVVTLAGRSHLSRVGVSLLTNAGLGDLAASSAEEYVSIATRLARDRDRLTTLRGSLRGKMQASPLMDAPRFARDVEVAYRRMWRAHCGREALAGTAS